MRSSAGEIQELRIAIKQTAHRNSNYRAHSDNDKFVINAKKETHASTVSRKRIKVAEEKLKRIEADPIPQPPDELRFDGLRSAVAQGRMPVIVSRLGKRYGDKTVLDDVSFTVRLHSRIVVVRQSTARASRRCAAHPRGRRARRRRRGLRQPGGAHRLSRSGGAHARPSAYSV
ncbi:MAG: hypothetical protein U0521_02705 [Anaerolineae bacterium]